MIASPTITRAFEFADLDVRADGRTLHGVAVPFNRPATIRDANGVYTETFRRGAFARTLAERGARSVKLLAIHNAQVLPLGRLSSATETDDALRIEARVSQTRAGDEALTLIRDGALDRFSIGFAPVPGGDRWNTDRTAVERVEVRLIEVSVVPFAAYDDARIVGVRHDQPVDVFDPNRDPDLLARRWTLERLCAGGAR